MKKTLMFVLAVAMTVLCLAMFASADTAPVTVTLNGETIDCASYGQEATIVEGRTLVPLRAIFEALGASVEWDGTTKTVTSVLDETEIKLTIGEKALYKNGEAVELDVPAMIMNDRTLVPVRAISESFGVNVEWDGENRTVVLVKEKQYNAAMHAYGDFYFGMTEDDVISKLGETDYEEDENLIKVTSEEKHSIADSEITAEVKISGVDFVFRNDVLVKIYVVTENLTQKENESVITQITEHFGVEPKIKKDGDEYIWNPEESEMEATATVYHLNVTVQNYTEYDRYLELEIQYTGTLLDSEDVENEEIPEEEETLPKTKAYGDFFFGMSIEEAKAAAKGEVKQLKLTGADDINKIALHITDEENEFDDEDWLVTGKLDCEKIELIFKNDILYSVTVTIEHQENLKDASEVYEKITDYYNLDKEITNIFPKNWVEALSNDVDTSELLEDGELIEFPKKIEKYDSVGCFLMEKLDDGKKIGYYTSFDVTNQWYYQYAMEQETEPEFADLLQKYPFGATKQQTINTFKGTIKDDENRMNIHNVQDQMQFVNDPFHRYYPENDIYGQGFDCNYISLEYDDIGLDRFYARTEETTSIDEATYSLNVIVDLYGEKKAISHEDKNVYEWKNYKYRIYDGTEKTANIYAGIIQVDNGNYYCFVSARQVKDGVNSSLDEEGRIIDAD